MSHPVIVNEKDGSQFEQMPEDTVLRAGLRAGIGLSYECNSGGCGACKFDLLHGEVETLWADAPGLGERDRRRGRHLACQCRALGSVTIKAATGRECVPPIHPQRRRAVFTGSSDITHDLREFRFTTDGAADFLPETKDGRRKDGRDLMLEMRNKGYDIVRNQQEMESTPLWRAPKVLGLFNMGQLAYADQVQVSASQPTLADLVLQAILLLQYNPKGYLLVVDAGLAGKAASQNAGERTLREIASLDQAVAVAKKFAGENALIGADDEIRILGLR